MPRRKKDQIPRHCRHKASGRGYVTIDGNQLYTGPWPDPDGRPSDAAEAKYRQILAGWIAAGKRMAPTPRRTEGVLTVRDLADRYAEFALGYYRKDYGDERGPVVTTKGLQVGRNMRDLAATWGDLPATAFGIDQFHAMRDYWVARGHCRRTVNHYARTIKRAFRWGAERKLVPASIWHDLAAVEPIRKGRTAAKDYPRIRAAQPAKLTAAIAEVRSPTVRDMLTLQWTASMRPGEVCRMRAGEVDRAPEEPEFAGLWVYRPESHKKAHEEDDGETRRIILFGERGQSILGPYLDRCREPDEFVFRNGWGNPFAGEYYARVLRKARRRAGLADRIVPNAIRKTRASEIRAAYGLEAAQSSLGHKNRETTERFYAEAPIDDAIRAARESG